MEQASDGTSRGRVCKAYVGLNPFKRNPPVHQVKNKQVDFLYASEARAPSSLRAT